MLVEKTTSKLADEPLGEEMGNQVSGAGGGGQPAAEPQQPAPSQPEPKATEPSNEAVPDGAKSGDVPAVLQDEGAADDKGAGQPNEGILVTWRGQEYLLTPEQATALLESQYQQALSFGGGAAPQDANQTQETYEGEVAGSLPAPGDESQQRFVFPVDIRSNTPDWEAYEEQVKEREALRVLKEAGVSSFDQLDPVVAASLKRTIALQAQMSRKDAELSYYYEGFKKDSEVRNWQEQCRRDFEAFCSEKNLGDDDREVLERFTQKAYEEFVAAKQVTPDVWKRSIQKGWERTKAYAKRLAEAGSVVKNNNQQAVTVPTMEPAASPGASPATDQVTTPAAPPGTKEHDRLMAQIAKKYKDMAATM